MRVLLQAFEYLFILALLVYIGAGMAGMVYLLFVLVGKA